MPESSLGPLPSVGDVRVDRVVGALDLPTPLAGRARFTEEADRVLAGETLEDLAPALAQSEAPPSFEIAGARRRIAFDPATTTAGIVTCGGLCPGINNVIRALVLTLHHGYGIHRIFGYRYGFAGIADAGDVPPPYQLTPELVEPIHARGGSVLGSSRGPQDVAQMVDRLQEASVDLLFTIGGDGTLRGAHALAREIERRRAALAVVGVPKTIDNDIRWIDRSFGFATAVGEARHALRAAHAEAKGAWNGIGLVKLMGRHSGFIAAHATLASSDVNFCLVPEVDVPLDGDHGLLERVEARLRDRHHAVVVVAEGAGQEHLEGHDPQRVDASGNRRLGDIGVFLKRRLGDHLTRVDLSHTIKYIDPSYSIRSQPANAIDAEYCMALAQHAVHAAMSGRTNLVVGSWNGHYTHVPIPLAVSERKTLRAARDTWQRVLEATGQPAWATA